MPNRPVILTTVVGVGLLIFLLLDKTFSPSYGLPTYKHPSQPSFHSPDPHLNERLAHAEKLWQKAVVDRHKIADRMGYSRKFPDGYMNPYNVWDFARPSFFCPHDLERIGSLGDGGKVVCGMTRYERESPGPSSNSNPASELIVYSFGVSRDSSFEAMILQRTNARIWGYDYSVGSWAKEITEHQLSRAYFNKIGLGKETDLERSPPMSTIQDLMKENGHTFIDLVKMDIEGAEFDVLTSLIDSITMEGGYGNISAPFGQLLIEIHFMKEPPGFTIPQNLDAWMKWWSSLENMGLRPVNNEDNWIGDVAHGKPRFMEYTLINVLDHRNKLLRA